MKTAAKQDQKQVTEAPHPPAQVSSTARQKSGSWLKPLAFWGGGLVLVGLTVLSLQPSPIPVEVAAVDQGPLRVTVDEEGRTRVRERFIISAPVSGRLQRIEWDPGDQVEVGDLLAQLDPLPFNTSIQSLQAQLQEFQAQQRGVETLRPKPETLQQAQTRITAAQSLLQAREAEVEQASAALEQAQRERERSQELEEAGVLSREERELAELTETTRQKELERAQQQFQVAETDVAVAQADLEVLQAEQTDPDYLLEVYGSRIEAIEAELTRLQDDAARTDIRSPVRGQILNVMQESAQVVTEGTTLLEIGDPQDLELVVDVLSQDALQIEPGDPVWMELEPGQPIQIAQVSRVEPSAFTKVSALGVEEQRVNVIADLVSLSDIPLAWGDGYRVDVQIGILEEEAVLKVPTSALFRCEMAWCVFKVNEGRAKQQLLQLGPRNDREAVVLEGLTAGETVILYPSEQVEDGIRVEGTSS